MNAWHRRLVAFALANCACGAYAHSPVSGMDNLYSGILHPVLVLAIADALHWPGPSAVRLSAVACLGVLLGLYSTPDGLRGSQLWLSLAGTWLTIALIVAAMILLCQVAARPWQRIAFRAIASWLAASALVVVALVSVKPAKTAAPNRSGVVRQR